MSTNDKKPNAGAKSVMKTITDWNRILREAAYKMEIRNEESLGPIAEVEKDVEEVSLEDLNLSGTTQPSPEKVRKEEEPPKEEDDEFSMFGDNLPKSMGENQCIDIVTGEKVKLNMVLEIDRWAMGAGADEQYHYPKIVVNEPLSGDALNDIGYE